MSMVTSNRLLPLLAGSVVLMAALVAVKSCSPDEEQAQVLEAVPQAPKPDADSPADTIKTLTANVSAMTSELNALRRDNTALKTRKPRVDRGPQTDRKQRADPSAAIPGSQTVRHRVTGDDLRHCGLDRQGDSPDQPLRPVGKTFIGYGF